jgi:hypothetical protein
MPMMSSLQLNFPSLIPQIFDIGSK